MGGTGQAIKESVPAVAWTVGPNLDKGALDLMPIPVVLSYAAAYFSLIIAAGVLLRDQQSFVHRIFAVGMALFAAEELCFSFVCGALLPDDILFWQKRALLVGILLPSIWLVFSVTYARVNPRQYL